VQVRYDERSDQQDEPYDDRRRFPSTGPHDSQPIAAWMVVGLTIR
jgi:hypothetical protein